MRRAISGDGVYAAVTASSRPALRLAMGSQAFLAAWCVVQRLVPDAVDGEQGRHVGCGGGEGGTI